MENKINISLATKSEWNKVIKTYEKGDKYIVFDPNLGNLLCNVYNTPKEVNSEGDGMTKKEFQQFKDELLNVININQTKILNIVEKNEKSRKDDFEAYKIQVEKQRQEDRAEMNQNIISLRTEFNSKIESITTLIKTNHIEITDRLDKLESDVRMLKSFHTEDIDKYQKQESK